MSKNLKKIKFLICVRLKKLLIIQIITLVKEIAWALNAQEEKKYKQAFNNKSSNK